MLTILMLGTGAPFARAAGPYFPYLDRMTLHGSNEGGQMRLWGLLDSTGQVVVSARFTGIGGMSGGFVLPEGESRAITARMIPVESERKWGYINGAGEWLIAPAFDDAGYFHEGLALVEVGDLSGYIDSTGTMVIPAKFAFAGDFSEGLADAAQQGTYDAGYIDRTGNWAIKPKFSVAFPFHEGRAAVERSSGWSYIDRTGRPAFKGSYEFAGPLQDDRARVMRNDRWGYVDSRGTMVVSPRFSAASDFSEGLAAVCTSEDPYRKDDWGFIDREGRMIIPPQKWSVGNFSEGLASVQPAETNVERTSDGGITTRGEALGPPRVIDRTGHVVFTLENVSRIESFCGGLAWVTFEDDGVGYVNARGELVWGPARPHE